MVKAFVLLDRHQMPSFAVSVNVTHTLFNSSYLAEKGFPPLQIKSGGPFRLQAVHYGTSHFPNSAAVCT